VAEETGAFSVEVRDAASGALRGPPISGAGDLLSQYAWLSANGDRVLLKATRADRPRVWDAAAGRPLAALDVEPRQRIAWAAFRPDGRAVATAVAVGDSKQKVQCQLWEADTGKALGS